MILLLLWLLLCDFVTVWEVVILVIRFFRSRVLRERFGSDHKLCFSVLSTSSTSTDPLSRAAGFP